MTAETNTQEYVSLDALIRSRFWTLMGTLVALGFAAGVWATTQANTITWLQERMTNVERAHEDDHDNIIVIGEKLGLGSRLKR